LMPCRARDSTEAQYVCDADADIRQRPKELLDGNRGKTGKSESLAPTHGKWP
jgi:hypothetical protein